MRVEGTVETKSRLKVWYLKTFSGCRILSIHSRPIVNMGNSVVYRRSYVLISTTKRDTQENLTAA